MSERLRIIVKGVVQGVGFRPFVFNLARSLNLKGYVNNSSRGVTIEVEGEQIGTFVERLTKEAPPLSQIVSVDVTELAFHGYRDFTILESEDEGSFTLISPDVSICSDCLREMLDRRDRRYLYPFINCTNCGPRYTITTSVPYDRPNTTMAVFPMCPDCRKEYHDPSNRRFHAQPIACPVCGPHVELRVKGARGKAKQRGNAIAETIRLLKQGAIVAIKGLGGFHIACDATNQIAVDTLRQRKRKSNKPFALMAPDISRIKKFCEVSPEEEHLLLSSKRPIVLLTKKKDTDLPESISPKNPCIGFMLPYTPLHYLLFYHPKDSATVFRDPSTSPHFEALVMTSGNLSEEPIVIDNREALEKLSGIVDAILLHNRDIFMRVDDSVVRVTAPYAVPRGAGSRSLRSEEDNGGTDASARSRPSITYFIRRSRGYVPDPISLQDEGPEVLGCGADIKNVFTLTKGSFAIPSQHIGDMENYETLRFFEESLKNLASVYRVEPQALAYDLHPMYLSSQWATRQDGIKKVGIQHHYAHVASVMAEHGLKNRVIGVSFDGTGYGADGTLWGGEFLIADLRGFIRGGHLKYTPLPGGENAIREPWRIAVSYIKDAMGADALAILEALGFLGKYGEEQVDTLFKIIENGQFSPPSTGVGRLFDAVSSLIGVCDHNTFEGEAAIALEAIAASDVADGYDFDLEVRETAVIDFSKTICGIVEDMMGSKDAGVISAKFHNTVVDAIQTVVARLSSAHGLNDVVLCGGVFQNMYLLERVIAKTESSGMKVHIHEKVPTNDAGISLGQAYILRERVKEGIV